MKTNKYENALNTVNEAERMAFCMNNFVEAYFELNKEWVRCKEICKATPSMVGQYFSKLVDNGLAEVKIVEDTPIKIKDTEHIMYTNNIPSSIPAYDKKGNYLGLFANPRYHRTPNRKVEWKNIEVEKTIYPTHKEYKIYKITD